MTITLLSAGAPKLGVRRCATAFGEAAGHAVELETATAPAIRERMEAGAAADVLVAPVPDMERYAARGLLAAGQPVAIGAVTAGVAVRKGVAAPDLGSVDDLVRALREADAVIYNTASSGRYIEELIGRLGLAAALAAKTERFPTGAAAMQRLAEGSAAREIGFGQIPEIRRFAEGVELAGPLPVAVGKQTAYAIAALAAADAAARALVAFFATPEARRMLRESGLENL